MKRLLLIFLIITLFLLSSCEQKVKNENGTKVQYIEMNACYRPYSSAQELADDADSVFIGKVTKISFQVLDLVTALPHTKDTKENDLTLYTI